MFDGTCFYRPCKTAVYTSIMCIAVQIKNDNLSGGVGFIGTYTYIMSFYITDDDVVHVLYCVRDHNRWS